MNNGNRPNSGNYMTALVLSAVVLLLWHFFFIAPMAERQRLAAEAAKAQQTVDGTAPAAPGAVTPGSPASAGPVKLQTREAALSSGGARVAFENDKVDGSIRLTGAQIDNLRLKKYREQLDPNSDEVVFLSPQGTATATYAETGWAAAPGSQTRVPDATTVWTSSGQDLSPDAPLTLTWDNGQGQVFTRRISIDQDYMFTVTDSVRNSSGAPITLFPYAIASREGAPTHAAQWTLHEGLFGVLAGLLEKYNYVDMRDSKEPQVKFDGSGGWLGITDKYWMVTVIPPQKEKFTGRFSISRENQTEVFRADYLLGGRNVAAGGTTTVTHHVFAGAKIVSLVEDYQSKLDIFRYDMTIDWGWFSFFTYWIFKALEVIYHQVGNFGVAIIILTILVKLLFYPLANASYKSMTKMKKVQPEMKDIQERFKEDKVKAQQEILALYRREKINPFMGCVPLLLQIPIFFSLYKVLFVTIEMRHAPFFGWVQDLAAADPTNLFTLFGLLPFEAPTWLHIGVWPLIMGFTMWFQMKMSPPSPDPTQRQMMMIMPPMFTYLMATFPAELVVYWTLNNILSIGQQYIIMRRLNVPLDISFKLPSWLGGAKGAPPEFRQELMDETQAPGEASRSWLKRGHQLFTQPCTFLRAVTEIDQLTNDSIPEIAFAGRSNVGKSSLVNAVVNRKSLARVSNTPGRTKEIILFDLAGQLMIADLPGYGFARVSKAVSAHWHRLIDAYLRTRPQLKRVCLLIDSRHPPHDSDRLMMEILDSAAVSYVIVLTKMDKLNATERQRAINDAIELRQHHVTIHPELFATSSETAEGLPELRAHLARLAKPADKGYKPANREMR